MTTVLVADDQPVVRAGLAALLGAHDDIDVVAEAADGRDAVDLAARHRPDVALLDVRMPVLDGLAAAQALLGDPPAAGYRPRVVMLTTFDLDEYVYEALRLGASGFLLKDSPPDQLGHAVRVVARGDTLLAPSVTRRLVVEHLRRQPRRPVAAEALAVLTRRETEVLTLIARGLSNHEIAARLVLAEDTVKTHVGRIFAKLGLRDRAQAVVAAYENELVTPGDE